MRPSRAFLLALFAFPACTTLHSVGGGGQPGEFYAVVQKSFIFGLNGQSYIIHCKEITDPLGTDLVCNRVLVASEAGQLAPATSSSGRVKFTRQAKP